MSLLVQKLESSWAFFSMLNDFLPLPLNEELVSQPLYAWKKRKAVEV
jgi:hypothetical protein